MPILRGARVKRKTTVARNKRGGLQIGHVDLSWIMPKPEPVLPTICPLVMPAPATHVLGSSRLARFEAPSGFSVIRYLQTLRQEFRPMLKLAAPLVMADLGWMGMGIVDTMMVGRVSAQAIGAVSLGSVLFYTVAI